MAQNTTGKITLAVFDFDGTITKTDTFNDFIIWKFGILSFLLNFVQLSPLIVLYKLGFVDNVVPKGKLFKRYFEGMKEQDFIRTSQTYSLTRIDSLIRKETQALIQWHKEKGHQLIIVSGSLESWIDPWAKKNGFDAVIGTKQEVVNGVLTGRFTGENCYGMEKVNRLELLFPKTPNHYIYAYGDSKGDRELIGHADQGRYIKRKYFYKKI